MKFTIGLPITKTSFFQETLDSIDKQSFKDFELIIRNNASSEEVKKKIREGCAGRLDKENVTYFESDIQLNLGDNFNALLNEAKGTYFTILSDDDVIYPDYLKEFDQLTEKYPEEDLFHCRIREIDENGELVNYGCISPEYESHPEFLFHHLMNNRGTGLNCIWKTSALRNIGGYPRNLVWDSDSLVWLLLGKNGVVASPKILFDYRQHSQNLSNDIDMLVVRLKDIKVYKDEIDKIIDDPKFQEKSIFPSEYLKEINEAAYQRKKRSIFYQISRQVNLLQLTDFYLKNRKEMPLKEFAKSAFAKFSSAG